MKKDGPAFFEVLKSALYTNGEESSQTAVGRVENAPESDSIPAKTEPQSQMVVERNLPPQPEVKSEMRPEAPLQPRYLNPAPQQRGIHISLSTILFCVLFYILSLFIAFYIGARSSADGNDKRTEAPANVPNTTGKPDPQPPVIEKPKWTIQLVVFDASTAEKKKQAKVNAAIAESKLRELGYKSVKVEEKVDTVTVYYGQFDSRTSKEAKDTLEKLRQIKYKTDKGMNEIFKGADFVKMQVL